jgi:hypothetical protein
MTHAGRLRIAISGDIQSAKVLDVCQRRSGDGMLIDIAAVFVYDMSAMRTTGKAWGMVGASTEIRNIPAGAYIEPLASAVYPAELLPV